MVHIKEDDCKGCGICLSVCPVRILEFSDDYNARGVRYPRVTDPARCTSCGNCMIYCPDFAMVVDEDD